jgi:hypothetical protein
MIHISNLDTAETDSFLTDLQDADTTQVLGGTGHGYNGGEGGEGRGEGGEGRGEGYGRGKGGEGYSRGRGHGRGGYGRGGYCH